MATAPRRRRLLSGGAVLLTLIAISLSQGAATSAAAGTPILGATWSSNVDAHGARLHAEIDPNGDLTAAHFDYTTKAAFDLNGFNGAQAVSLGNVGSGSGSIDVTFPAISGLAPGTVYLYRLTASNIDGQSVSPPSPPYQFFVTQALGGGILLPDSRGWEMVSPVDKNGGQIDPPGAIAGGGVLQAAANGGEVTYGSSASFAGGTGAPPASQYLASRSASGWATQNITAPIFSGTYDLTDQGVPYQFFSPDLSNALLLNGEHCRGDQASGCAVANPPLGGTDAPAGYQDYYLRDNGTSSFDALLTSTDIGPLGLDPATFDLHLVGSSSDLQHVVLSSCSKLTADASDGCPSAQNLYEWSAGAGLASSAINGGTPGAALAAPAGVVSADGSRVYWNDTASGDLYLHDGSGNHLVDTASDFQTATPDGATAFYLKETDLYRYDAAAHTSSGPLASGVVGVLGASGSGDTVYFQDGSGLQRWHANSITQVAPNQANPAADAAATSDYPPATGTARVSDDGAKLLFVSTARLTATNGIAYDNLDSNTKDPDSEVFLYDAAGPTLTCVSCNPTNERPIGPATIPGAIPNGTAPDSTDSHKPRVLSADGRRVFFDSADSLAVTDTNAGQLTDIGVGDAYQWEAQGEGNCAAPGGCTTLISSGRSTGGAQFIDASANGSDAFFLTDDSLVGADPGAIDLYDARIGGGFPTPQVPIPCEGDACQSLPSPPTDPTLTTLLSGHGNPAIAYHRLNCKPGFAKRKGKCVRRHHRPKKHHAKKRHKRGGRG